MHGTNTKNGVVQYKEEAVMTCCGVMLLAVETTRLFLGPNYNCYFNIDPLLSLSLPPLLSLSLSLSLSLLSHHFLFLSLSSSFSHHFLFLSLSSLPHSPSLLSHHFLFLSPLITSSFSLLSHHFLFLSNRSSLPLSLSPLSSLPLSFSNC